MGVVEIEEIFVMKKLIALSITAALMLTMAGCSEGNSETARESDRETRESTERTVETEPVAEPTEPSAEPDPVSGAAGGFITPYTAEYIPDEWEPELDQYLFGMIDLEGKVIYEPQFSSVRYIENCGAYIVGGETDGVTLYGIMNDDGEEFTGLIYDGAYYDLGMTEDESGHFYMTTYTDGILHVTTYEDDLVITDDGIDITIDEDALPYTFTNLGVCHMAMNGALIRDCDEVLSS